MVLPSRSNQSYHGTSGPSHVTSSGHVTATGQSTRTNDYDVYRDVALEASPPRYRPMGAFSRENTTYGSQNVWMNTQDRYSSPVPVTMSDAHWAKQREANRPRSQMSYQASNDYFQQYMTLVNRKAYRYPNPGPPKFRNGNVGSNWRHVRQVLGYGGNNICFIDGVVKQYDLSNFNQELAARRPYQSHRQATPLYAINQNDVTDYKKHITMEEEKHHYKPWQPSLPPISTGYRHHYN